MKKFYLVFLMFALLGCSESKKDSEKVDEVVEEEPVIENFSIEVRFQTDASDKFRLLLNEFKEDGDVTSNVHVTKDVKEAGTEQVLKQEVLNPNFPNEILIDLGKTSKKVVKIDAIVIKSRDHNIIIPSNKVDHFFYPNQFLIHNSSDFTYKVDTLNKNQFLIFRQRILDSLWLN